MHIVFHVSKFYDWVPVPKDTKIEDADVKAGRVKPAADGGWVMRITKTLDTHTTVGLPENQIIATMIMARVRDNESLTRAQAVANHLSRHVMPHHAHRDWMTKIELHDTPADEKLFDEMVGVQVEAGNIAKDEVDEMRAAYLAPADHLEHLHAHFGVKKGAA